MIRVGILALVLATLSACAAVNQGNVHAHGGPAGGDWEGHVAATDEAPKPKAKDRDNDGTPDRFDNCPDEPGPPVNRGCSAKQRVEIVDGRIQILEKVHFQTGDAIIEADSNDLLDNIAAVLNQHPELTRIEVSGHTDNTGDPAFNLDLSGRRAQAVVDALVSRSVDAARLSAVGKGSEQPVADNGTEEGRAQNRRVEFVIVASSDG